MICTVTSIPLMSNFRNGDFDGFTWFFESKNLIFSGRSLCVCICARVPVINIKSKQIVTETPNLVFYFCIMCRCFLKLFMKIERIVCVQKHKKNSIILLPMDGISWNILMYSDCNKYDEIDTHEMKIYL